MTPAIDHTLVALVGLGSELFLRLALDLVVVLHLAVDFDLVLSVAYPYVIV